MSALLEDFLRAGAAAKVVDDLTGQKDCVDPEKATLQERVRELERKVEELIRQVGAPAK